MTENKTQKTKASVEAFLAGIKEEGRRNDCIALVKIMKAITKEEPKMWGPAIVGFGDYHYKYESGREGDFFITGFSPRKQNISLYLIGALHHFPELVAQLGKYKTSKSCLYINKLEDIDLKVLKQLIASGVKRMKKTTAKG